MPHLSIHARIYCRSIYKCYCKIMRPRAPWAWLLQVINANLALKQYPMGSSMKKICDLSKGCKGRIYFLLAFKIRFPVYLVIAFTHYWHYLLNADSLTYLTINCHSGCLVKAKYQIPVLFWQGCCAIIFRYNVQSNAVKAGPRKQPGPAFSD